MQLVRYAHNGHAEIGVFDAGRVLSISKALDRYLNPIGTRVEHDGLSRSLGRDPKALLSLGSSALDLVSNALHAAGAEAVVAEDGLTSLRFLPFVTDPSKVLGLGYNYKSLCEKESVEYPESPQLFAKMPTSLAGPHDDVEVPAVLDKVDFESELCVIIGRTARAVSREDALSYVGGYTVMNDITAKILPRPRTEAQTTTVALKGADNFAPIGAVVVTPDELGDPSELEMVCRVNGEERQRYLASDMIHDVAATIAYTSSFITLLPGDMISMGTSLGIGIIEIPPRLLHDGDRVECEIDGYPGCNNIFRIPGQLRAGTKSAAS